MLEFNNNHLITGYIKQLLSEFNLPTYKVYSKENAYWHEYAKTHPGFPKETVIESIIKWDGESTEVKEHNKHIRYIPYIKDDIIQLYAKKQGKTEAEWIRVDSKTYAYNKNELNHTKNLIIKNNIYDYYTHEYLGDYLRFMRDFNDVDLLSMYNCFSNNVCKQLKIDINISSALGREAFKTSFDSSDSNYKIYMFPVKLNQNYTIAIDSDLPYEICCGLYGKYREENQSSEIVNSKLFTNNTYIRVNNSRFSAPFVYNKLRRVYDFVKAEKLCDLAQNEHDLKMFIKLPANNKSSIVVLEGNYTSWTKDNVFITNLEEKDGKSGIDIFKPYSELQLLKLNDNLQHPFADRLLEFLTSNAVFGQDENLISDNVRRLQALVHTSADDYFPGFWDKKYNVILYNYMKENKLNYSDLTGYIDKDVENNFKTADIFGNTIDTLKRVNIYKDDEGHYYG